HGAVARAVDQADLTGHGGWLVSLASLIVPERGVYLVAGLLGAALAGVSLDPTAAVNESALRAILANFGFALDEATYLESRLQAGGTLIALTTRDLQLLAATRQTLGNNNAVHISVAATSPDIVAAAGELLVSHPEVFEPGDVVVTDAVAPLQLLLTSPSGAGWAIVLQGARVVDRAGVESGRIEDLIADAANGASVSGVDQVRYVVISFGGLLGLCRRLTAIPAGEISLNTDPVRLSVERAVLHNAPAYDPDAPFSRREELVVCAYFGCAPYWPA
ncbi:MAG TPA: PRC-barrel domain-containing protein, partial [Methylomirabilota bacterium]|nr:PRC-barrel domain-containing protein [Methylomirabilota bacterium]